MKALKIVGVIVVLLIAVAAASTWYFMSNINSIVKDVIESVGTESLKTPVRVNAVNIKLLDGSGELSGFSIDNYEGFSQPKLLSFDTVKLDIDPLSLNKPVIVLDELTIKNVAVTAEQKGTGTNIQALLKSLPQSGGDSPEKSTSGAERELRFALKKLSFVDNSVNFATENYGIHKLDLPKIEQTNIGSTEQGLSPEELAVEVLKPLLEAAKKRVEREARELAKRKLEEKYGEQIESGKEKLKGELKDKLGDDADEKLKKLKGLF